MDRSREIFVCLISAMALLVFSVVFLLAEDETVIGTYMVGGALLLWLMVRMGAYAKVIAAVSHHERLWAGLLFIASLILLFFFRDNHYCLFLIGTIFCYTIAVLGLNVQLGYTGVINFSAASFFGVGGYTAGMLLNQWLVPPLVALLMGGVMAGLVGCVLLLPVLRTSGHYSALVTMAFALLFNVFLEVNESFGGPQGIAVPPFSLFGVDFASDVEWGMITGSFYLRYDLFILLFLALVFTMVRRVERSWMGLAMDAVRLDETASACFGINIVRWKVTAFTMGNVLMGMAGAVYAMMLGYISPANFTFSDSLLFLSILLLGGMGNCWGVILATSIMVVLPEKLQFIQEYRYLLYSLLVLLMIVYRPMGLLPRRTRVVTSEDVA